MLKQAKCPQQQQQQQEHVEQEAQGTTAERSYWNVDSTADNIAVGQREQSQHVAADRTCADERGMIAAVQCESASNAAQSHRSNDIESEAAHRNVAETLLRRAEQLPAAVATPQHAEAVAVQCVGNEAYGRSDMLPQRRVILAADGGFANSTRTTGNSVNMQVTVVAATMSPKPKATTTTITTTRTRTPISKNRRYMWPPAQRCNRDDTEKTKDFNSRRRRGRLRHSSRELEAPLAAHCHEEQHSWASTAAGAAAEAAARSAAIAKCVAAEAGNAACRSALRRFSLLLSFFIDYYVNITKLVLSTITSRRRATRASRAVADTAVAAVSQARPNTFTTTSTTTPNREPVEKSKKCEGSRAISAAAATTSAARSSAAPKMRAARNMKFMYAVILCTSVLLPCSSNLAAAAKPKSATQLQQQKQQHQQQQEQHHLPQHVASVAFDSNGVGVLTPPSYQVVPQQTSNEDTEFIYPSQFDEQMFDEEQEQTMNGLDSGEDPYIENATVPPKRNTSDAHGNENANVTKLFPKDLFTMEELQHGAVIFHIIGVIYMFVALAIVCDEFFVPSLDVIIEKLDITDDVAGATFMAAGGSAPELFTSVIGVFISFDDVGIGTIVGSAVFNILFVIGMCAIFSKTVLTLTWWPLFRDCSFYSISLMVLIYFFRDNLIYWWEALILFFIYFAYVTFMKWNVQVERCVKKVITKNKGNAANSSETSMATQPGGSVTSRAASETRSGPHGSSSGAGATGNSSGGTAGSTQTGAKFRHGLLQLMIHTIDPLHDGKVDEKATQLHAIASLKVLLDATKPQRGGATTSAANHVKINLKETTLADRPNGNIDTTLDSGNDVEDDPEPLSMAWPDNGRKQLTYILVAPLLIPMWLTLPDTRTPRGKRFFPITFIGSILWIAAFSYFMVWWANVAGDTAGIPPEVMGLTFLAAGTSIPDLITSVIVARKGFGDMAVSSSVGSNIFDVTVGLPIPWLLYGIIYSKPVEVNSNGMVCSITILFMMLIFVVMSIACFRWKMNKGLGFTMFLLYFVFVAVSLLFEYEVIVCPA